MGNLLDLKMTGFVCASDGDIGRLGVGMAVKLWDMTGRSDAIARAAALNDLGCASVAPSWYARPTCACCSSRVCRAGVGGWKSHCCG